MRTQTTARASRGFTLVEVMVGMLIGLIATVVIFQVFAVSEGQKRTTTGGSDAQQNGGFSLFQIERDIRMAGFGINHMALLGCQVNGWYEPAGAPISFRLVPVEITNGAGGAPDQIRIVFGSADLFSAPVRLQSAAAPTTRYHVDNRFGFREGDLVIAAANGQPCTLAQVNALPTGVLADRVSHDSGNYLNAQGASVPTQFNRVGGLLPPNDVTYAAWNPALSTGGRLYNIGPAPTVVTYGIQNSQLVAINGLTPGVPGATAVLADGIVQMQVQYGYDGNGDGRVALTAASNAAVVIGSNVDSWSDSMPAAATALEWSRVIAVRLVVTARSQTPERPNPTTGLCETTVALHKWIAPDPRSPARSRAG